MDRHTKAIIATLCTTALMIGTDFTGALLLVVPIEHEFSVDITTTQWVLNIYALTFSMMIVSGGRLGDMLGRRRLILIGLAIFFVASVVCTVAPSITWLIGARAVQGIGSAIVWPCLIGLGMTVIDEKDRGLVMGLIIGATASGNVIGPVIAGVVSGLGEWRLFFLFNVIMALVSALLIWLVLNKDTAERVEERIDYGGMVVLSIAILALLYALDIGADGAWTTPMVIGLFVASLVALVAFPFVERLVRDPMVPPPMMRNRQFLLTLSTNGLVVPTFFLAFLYFPQYLQKMMGWDVLVASLGVLPLMISTAGSSLVSGRFYNGMGPRRLLFTGYGIAGLGALWVYFMDPAWGYWGLVPAMVLIGLGGGTAVSPAGAAAVSAVDPSRAGLAGGLSFMFHLGFGAIGVAGGTAIFYEASRSAFSAVLYQAGITMSAADQLALNAAAAHAGAAKEILGKFSAADSEKIVAAMTDAFATGLHGAYLLALASLFVGILVIFCIDESKLQSVDD